MQNISMIVSVVRKGWGHTVLEASVKAGASGGTVIFGRGVGVNEKESIFGVPIEPEKEIVLTLVYAAQSETILNAIVRAAELNEPGNGLAFVLAVDKVVGVPHIANLGLR